MKLSIVRLLYHLPLQVLREAGLAFDLSNVNLHLRHNQLEQIHSRSLLAQFA